MSNVFEMNGTVVYQGRPGHVSRDGDNWCYTITFLVNTSSPICDLSISTQDRGASLWPGGISLDPDINPETPEDDGVHGGVRVRRGRIPTDGPQKGTFVADSPQPDSQPSGEENRRWTSTDSDAGPWQPGGWRRAKVDGELPDPKESSDALHIEFRPCLQPGAAFQLRLCFDEELDENDFITFTPSADDGSAIGGGDTIPSTPLTFADIIKILGGLLGAGASKLVGQKRSNKEKRKEIAALVLRDRKLLETVLAAAAPTKALNAERAIAELGAAAILEAIGVKRIVETLGTKALAKQLEQLGLTTELKHALDES